VIESGPWLIFLSLLGIAGGLAVFARGILAYRTAAQVSTIAGSSTASMAAGEVSLTGSVEPGPTTLVSRLQSVPCVHYRSRIVRHRGRDTDTVLDEERSVSFRLRDEAGAVVVFPVGAEWSIEPRFSGGTGVWGDPPPELDLNDGAPMTMTQQDREAQIAALLTVHDPRTGAVASEETDDGLGLSGFSSPGAVAERLEYREERVEPGDTITVIGAAVPYGEMADLAVDASGAGASPLDDPEIAADLAEALANGTLRPTARDAWGNAAIPGFGIGQPAWSPDLEPGAADATGDPGGAPGSRPGTADGAGLDYDLGPDDLVIAGIAGRPLAIHEGTPAQAVGRHEARFWIGLGGAVLAVASAAVLLLQLGGAL
jgi:hypothetical protein